jgi:uncharacterized protein YktA (UPF0223 family)
LCRRFYNTDEEKELLLTAYRAILDLIPKLKKLVPIQNDLDEESEYFYKVVDAVRSSAHTPCVVLMYIVQMQGGCNTARSEAIRRIKQNTVAYLAAGRKPVKVDLQTKDKSSRGLNNPDFGRLIIPAEHLIDWDADPDAYVNPLIQSPADTTFTARGLHSTKASSKYGGQICLCSCTTTIHTTPTILKRVFSRAHSWYA